MNEYVNGIQRMMQKEAERQARVRKMLNEQAEREGDSPFATGLTGREYALYGSEESYEDVP